MYESHIAVIGNVVTHPVRRILPGGEQVVSFRMASTARRYDRDSGEWVDGGTLFLTVNCWRRLVAGVDASLRRGDPIIAYGQLRTTEYRTRNGMERRDLEMLAAALGPDLGRCSAAVVRHGPRNSADKSDVGPGVGRGEERPAAEQQGVGTSADELRTA
ncbi:single-stranded DNA-binding protein [Nocardia transvalensis]|uniref:single-stranded DNA-binding protein n=1 Tax=Nocardia transvalensis TaxID=37333 RepID=UPI001894E21F|nr:single-stranded DNA-binding protein [Nocardia transvalensis]MBF6331496.1 single-stranded DNA-binding protein [Nocardia transvalensis]